MAGGGKKRYNGVGGELGGRGAHHLEITGHGDNREGLGWGRDLILLYTKVLNHHFHWFILNLRIKVHSEF